MLWLVQEGHSKIFAKYSIAGYVIHVGSVVALYFGIDKKIKRFPSPAIES